MKENATFDAARLRYKDHWRLFAAEGIFDLMVDAAAIENYKQVARSSRRIRLAGSGVKVRIADPLIVLSSKRIANRDKDRRITGALKDAIDARANASLFDRLRERRQQRRNRRASRRDLRQQTTTTQRRQLAIGRAADRQRCGHVGERSKKPCIREPHRTGSHRYQ